MLYGLLFLDLFAEELHIAAVAGEPCVKKHGAVLRGFDYGLAAPVLGEDVDYHVPVAPVEARDVFGDIRGGFEPAEGLERAARGVALARDVGQAEAYAARDLDGGGVGGELHGLARALYAEGKLDDFIPDTLIEPVAEILKWAKQIQDARKEEEELDSVTLEELPSAETAESAGENETTGESV